MNLFAMTQPRGFGAAQIQYLSHDRYKITSFLKAA
jgi:hypothetical protein